MLLEVARLCAGMRENEEMCRILHDGAQKFYEHVEAWTQQEKLQHQTYLSKFQVTVTNILATMRKYQKRRKFLRIWGNHKVGARLKALSVELDDLYKQIGPDFMAPADEYRRMRMIAIHSLNDNTKNMEFIRAEIETEDLKEGAALDELVNHPKSSITSTRLLSRAIPNPGSRRSIMF